jgi:hypothetical protein
VTSLTEKLVTIIHVVAVVIFAAIWIFPLGPLLWLPLLVRSVALYAILLLAHAIVGTPIKATSEAVENSATWYFSAIVGIFSQLGSLLNSEDDVGSGVGMEPPSAALAWPEWLAVVFKQARTIAAKSAWTIIFWTTATFLLWRFQYAHQLAMDVGSAWQAFKALI